MLLQGFYQLGHSTAFLTNGYVNAVYGLSLFEKRTLVQNGIYGNGGFPGLAVANNQLTLTATNGNHGINSFKTGLQGLLNRLSEDDLRGLTLQGHLVAGPAYRALPVEGFPQGIDHPPDRKSTRLNSSHVRIS